MYSKDEASINFSSHRPESYVGNKFVDSEQPVQIVGTGVVKITRVR